MKVWAIFGGLLALSYKHGNFFEVDFMQLSGRNSSNKKWFLTLQVNDNIPANFWSARCKF